MTPNASCRGRTFAYARTGSVLVLASALTLLMATPADATPKADYDVDIACAAAAAATRTEVSDPSDQAHRAEADRIARWTLADAEASGRRLGLQAAAVDIAVQDNRANLVRYLHQPDPARAASERTELGRTMIRCALVHAIEQGGHGSADHPRP